MESVAKNTDEPRRGGISNAGSIIESGHYPCACAALAGLVVFVGVHSMG